MRKRVEIADNMVFLAADFSTMEGAVQEYGDNLVADFLQAIGRKGFAGLGVSRTSSTTVTVAPGRYYDGQARMYGLDAAQDIDLTPYLPTVGSRILAVVTYGQQVNANSAIRDFYDPETKDMVPRQVYLEKHRQVLLTIVAGAEAGTPVKPAIPADYLGIAYVTITTTGVADQAAITAIDENEIVSLGDAYTRVLAMEAWQRRVDASLSSLRGDMADISAALKGLAGSTAILTLAREVASIRELVGLPATYTASHADSYMTSAQSWTGHINWLAKVDEGLRFADANLNDQALQQLSSIDPNVTVSPGGLLLPKYTEVITVAIGDTAAERDQAVPMSQYQTVTISGTQLQLSRLRRRYGEEFVVSTGNRYWQTGAYDPVANIFARSGEAWVASSPSAAAGNHRLQRLTRYFEDVWAEAYWEYGGVPRAVTGKVLAQTRIAPASRWVTGYDLYFQQAAATGDVTLVVAGVKDGSIDLTQIYATVTKPAAQLHTGWNKFPIEPFVMLRGARYALVVVTSGDHWLMTSNTNDFTGGTLMTLADNQYSVALLNRDLCFREYCARFNATTTIVNLNPWTLDGGIAGVDVLAPCWHSSSAQLEYEFKSGGTWYTLSAIEGATPFNGLPALVEARIRMVHTNDLAPGIMLGTSRVRTSRPRTTFTGISNAWTTASAVSTVSLEFWLSGYDAAFHTYTPKLRHGAGYSTVVAASSVSAKARGDGVTVVTAVWSGLPAITSYCWQLEGTTSSALKPFVIEQARDAAL